MKSLYAGIVYAIVVFISGFLLGAIRTVFVVPRLGPTAAVALETPFMLVISWFASAWTVRRCDISPALGVRAAMGFVAFVTLQALESTLSIVVFDRTFAQYVLAFGSAAGLIGLAAQLAFATFPLLGSRKISAADRAPE